MSYIFSEFLANYGSTILYSILGGVFTWLGTTIKKIIKQRCDEQTKREVVDTVVQAVEQLYVELDGEAKLEKALEACYEMFAQKELLTTELELRLLIEASVTKLKGVPTKEAK